MTPSVAVTIDLGDVNRGLAAMEHRAHALTPVMKSLVKPLRDDQRNHKRAKESPGGAWAPRAASTLEATGRKLARNLLGKLPSAVSYRADANSVTATSLVAWSAAHRDGDVVGHGTRLPARESLWISAEMVELATREVTGALVEAYGGKR